MNNIPKSKRIEGVPHKNVIAYHVPEENIKQYNFTLDTKIIPIIDVNSLSEYQGDENIGDYYASVSDLLQRFYNSEDTKPTSIYKGALPQFFVPYKEEGHAAFIFDHFSLSWDKKTIYAVYVFNTTIS